MATLQAVFEKGRPGETYNIGGNAERKNIEVVAAICAILDRVRPKPGGKYADQITYVTDRPGHDHRYAIDASKIRDNLDWEPSITFEQGIEKTVTWYLENQTWWKAILNAGQCTKRAGLRNNHNN